jgi:hypothetical protein
VAAEIRQLGGAAVLWQTRLLIVQHEEELRQQFVE